MRSTIPGLEMAAVRADLAGAGLEQTLERMRLGEQRFKAQKLCERCRKQPPAVVRSANGARQALCRSCSGSPAPRVRSSSTPALPLAKAPAPAPAVTAPARRLAPIIGYAVVWNDERQHQPGEKYHCGLSWPYSESFASGSLRHFLASGQEVRALLNHNSARAIGSTLDGSLRLTEDDYGLAFELTPRQTGDGEIAVLCAGSGSINGVSPSSFDMDYAWDSPAQRSRQITRASLIEISLMIGSSEPAHQLGWAGLATPANQQRIRQLRSSRANAVRLGH